MSVFASQVNRQANFPEVIAWAGTDGVLVRVLSH
jgi:hypothetical protein